MKNSKNINDQGDSNNPSLPDPIDRSSPRGFLNLAIEYYESFTTICDKYPSITAQLHTKYFLICHAIELVIKAELRIKGVESEILKSRLFGHDFSKLIVKLHEHNIIIDKQSMIRLESINEYYKTKQFEYPLVGYKELVPLDPLQSLAHLWINKVNAKINNRLP